MTEKTKPHRAGSMSDTDRALVGKRHATATPVPIEEEATPLPSEPPAPEAVDGFSELSPALQKILRDQHNTLCEHDIALGRVWPARHVDAQLVDLRAAVVSVGSTISKLQNIPAALQSQAVVIREIQNRTAGVSRAATKLESTLDALHKELVEMKLEREREKGAREKLEQRVTNELAAVRKDQEDLREAREKEQAELRADRDKQSGRIKTLEEERTKLRAWAAILAFLAALAAGILGRKLGK